MDKRNRERDGLPGNKFSPSNKQIADEFADVLAYLDLLAVAIAEVAKWRTWSKANRVAKREVIECPVCKGRLHLSQAAYNGHVHGTCETEGCVSWME